MIETVQAQRRVCDLLARLHHQDERACARAESWSPHGQLRDGEDRRGSRPKKSHSHRGSSRSPPANREGGRAVVLLGCLRSFTRIAANKRLMLYFHCPSCPNRALVVTPLPKTRWRSLAAWLQCGACTWHRSLRVAWLQRANADTKCRCAIELFGITRTCERVDQIAMTFEVAEGFARSKTIRRTALSRERFGRSLSKPGMQPHHAVCLPPTMVVSITRGRTWRWCSRGPSHWLSSQDEIQSTAICKDIIPSNPALIPALSIHSQALYIRSCIPVTASRSNDQSLVIAKV